ncbi:hypothetical protein OESDEN_14747 [Oesophagostomum dentatum]|uniref:Uncharacterized protein n=1 Tax=Oesophagostomum dentatum TaxID=61180 RepID=A0A0B1SQP0_OESDE|nr:hypothetical protein OESDEN_14747 [Oesophagostomum dentatum]
MAVALAPVPKIDYSVTKGGARTWAVLLVFLFLCSGLYTIFSSKETSGSDAIDDDESQIEPPLEDQLFAGLRKKIENNIQRVKDYVQDRDSEGAEEEREEEKVQAPIRRGKRRKTKNVVESSDDVEEEPKEAKVSLSDSGILKM